MKINTVSVTYGAKRCENYQSVDVSMTTEIAVEPGETMEKAFAAAIKHMAPVVEAEAEAAIRRVQEGRRL